MLSRDHLSKCLSVAPIYDCTPVQWYFRPFPTFFNCFHCSAVLLLKRIALQMFTGVYRVSVGFPCNIYGNPCKHLQCRSSKLKRKQKGLYITVPKMFLYRSFKSRLIVYLVRSLAPLYECEWAGAFCRHRAKEMSIKTYLCLFHHF